MTKEQEKKMKILLEKYDHIFGDDGLEHPICYVSRLLNIGEKN